MFLIIRRGLWVWGRKVTKDKHAFHCVSSGDLSVGSSLLLLQVLVLSPFSVVPGLVVGAVLFPQTHLRL